MYVFLILLSQWLRGAAAKAWLFFVIPVIPSSADLIPDWAGKNSRFTLLRELARKSLIWLAVFAGGRPFYDENRQKSRYNGKKREFAPAGRAGGAVNTAGRRSSRRARLGRTATLRGIRVRPSGPSGRSRCSPENGAGGASSTTRSTRPATPGRGRGPSSRRDPPSTASGRTRQRPATGNGRRWPPS